VSVLARLAEIASHQHGVVTLAQARAAGVDDRRVRRLVERGLLRRMTAGVFVWTASAPTPHRTLMAAVLSAGAVAARRSALWLWDLHPAPSLPELVVPHRRAPTVAPARTRRTLVLPEMHITSVGSIPVTTVARSLVDAGAVLSDLRLEQVTHAALHRKLTDPVELSRTFLALARRGRPGIARVRRVLEAVDPTAAPAESHLEVRVLAVLRRAGLPEPVRQLSVAVSGRSLRLDLAYPNERVAIEVDGFRHHGSRSAFEEDRVRGNALSAAGWRVLHVTDLQLRTTPNTFIDAVRAALIRPEL
jgi:hypothetical protein